MPASQSPSMPLAKSVQLRAPVPAGPCTLRQRILTATSPASGFPGRTICLATPPGAGQNRRQPLQGTASHRRPAADPLQHNPAASGSANAVAAPKPAIPKAVSPPATSTASVADATADELLLHSAAAAVVSDPTSALAPNAVLPPTRTGEALDEQAADTGFCLREAHTHTVVEPFAIKVVEPMGVTTHSQRQQILRAAHWNLFKVQAQDVMIDLLTDSGTGALSSNQWSAMMHGDESYAVAQSWQRFQAVVEGLTGFSWVVPTHQGRAAESILFKCLGVRGKKVLANTLFDTTRANCEVNGGEGIDLPCAESSRDLSSQHPFKGNIDLGRLERLLAAEAPAGRVACVLLTITNNTGGGQPVSLENMRAARELCDRHGVPLFLDACRFGENSWFIKSREPGCADRSIRSIVEETFALCDGATFSAKKDGMCNIGGFLVARDEALQAAAEQALILTEGFITYGGLAGRDLEAIAVGLEEVVDEQYLQYRARSTAYLGAGLEEVGVPILQPPGGHAVYVDASALLPHIPPTHFPGHAVAAALYLLGGIRSCEVGTLMFGGVDPSTGKERTAARELCRLAIPRRRYTQSHIDYVIEIGAELARQKESLCGFELISSTAHLRHFTAKLRPLPCDTSCHKA